MGATEQTTEQVNPVAEAVATSAAQAVAEFDLSTPEGVRKAAEKFPAFKAVFSDVENAATQRTMAKIRREQGSDETIRAYHQRLVDEIKTRLDNGEDVTELGKDTPLFAKANREAVEAELYQRLYEQAKAADPDAVAALDGFAEQDGLSAEHWKGLAQAAMNAVANGTKKSALSEWLDAESIDDIPQDSKRYKAIRAYIEKELAVEQKARETEAISIPAGIETPSGAATEPMTRQRLDAMTPAERLDYIANASDAERDHLWEIAMTP